MEIVMFSASTVRQLAALAGISRTTISLALRNHPSVAFATRQRVQDLAKRSGYRRDPLVATLMTQLRTSRAKRSPEKLAYLTTWSSPLDWQRSSNDRLFYKGACHRAAEHGYQIEHFWASEPGLTHSHLSKILHTRGIRGVVLAPLFRHKGHLSLHWEHFAVAAVSHTVHKPDIHRANHHCYSGMIMALRSLKRRGYRRIGLATLLNDDERVNHGWLAAYLSHHYQKPAPEQIPPLMMSTWTNKEFKEWLEQYSPEVVLSNLEGPYWLLRNFGYRVPEDISYASLDLAEDKPFTGIDQLPEAVGACAVDLVTSQLQNNELGLPKRPRLVFMEGVWRDGNSTRHSMTAELPGKKAKRKAERLAGN
jgi:DNA-binding LacI/PurR family transcriptional regulator